MSDTLTAHQFGCLGIFLDPGTDCGCPTYTSVPLDLDDRPGVIPSDPERVYLATATRKRPIRWFEDYDQFDVWMALAKVPEHLRLSAGAWPDTDRSLGAYVVGQRRKVAPDEQDGMAETWTGWAPLAARRSQLEAIRWALADMEQEQA